MRYRQLNPQLDPPQPLRRRRSGIGQSLTDFAAAVDPGGASYDPQFAAGWSDIQTQIYSEAGIQVNGAGHLVDQAGNQIQQTASGLISQGGQVVDAAGNVLTTTAGQYIGQAQQAAYGVVGQAQGVADNLIGQVDARLQEAKLGFLGSYEGILDSGLSELTTNPADAAKRFVLLGKTIAGAVDNVSGLIQTFNQGGAATTQNLLQASQVFTGAMISVAISAGAVTAGLGALIVAGIGGLVTLMGKAGLLNTYAVPSSEICPGVLAQSKIIKPSIQIDRITKANNFDPSVWGSGILGPKNSPPSTYFTTIGFLVGCVAAYPDDPFSPQVSPGAANWRTFPINPSPDINAFAYGQSGDVTFQNAGGSCPMPYALATLGVSGSPSQYPNWTTDDTRWFIPIYRCGEGPGIWKGAVFDSGYTSDGSIGANSPNTGKPVPNQWAQSGKRPIDCAFDVYRYLECEMSQSNVTDFQKAFYTAWKANKEYELNGLKSQPDWQVFLHLVRVWNSSHLSGSIVVVTQKDSDLYQPFPGSCDTGKPKYYETLVSDAFNYLQSNPSDPFYIATPGQKGSQNGIILHDGNLRTTTWAVNPNAPISSPATVTKRVAAAGAASAAVVVLGAVAYSQMTGVALDVVAKQVWRGVKGVFVKKWGHA
jgi:hypothetical protein